MTQPLPEVEEGLVIHPGDTLILRYNLLTQAEADDIKQQVQNRLPGANVVIVVADGMAAYRDTP